MTLEFFQQVCCFLTIFLKHFVVVFQRNPHTDSDKEKEEKREKEREKIDKIFANIADRKSKPEALKKYRVFVDDNFHHMDESERYEHNGYPTLEEAITVCKEIVDGCLDDYQEDGVQAAKLYDHYVAYGEDPFIIGGESGHAVPLFSAWTYAEQRCKEICGR